MSSSFEFIAQARTETGTSAMRRLRRRGMIPAVVYGSGPAVHITLSHNEVMKQLANEAVFSHVLTINVDGQSQPAILKDMQRHAYRPLILHMDFQRISETEKIRMHVPLHFLGGEKAPGLKKGGAINHYLTDVEVACLPDRLPEFIEVDLSGLDVGHTVHLTDLQLPEGIELTVLAQGADHDLAVAAMTGGAAGAEGGA